MEWRTSVSHIQDAGDMAFDRKSKLVWTRCLVGQQLDARGAQCTGDATPMTLDEAERYAAAQPGGWRVPTAVELLDVLPAACPPDKDYWGGQTFRVALRGKMVMSSSRAAGGSGVLIPKACAAEFSKEALSLRAPVLLVTADDRAYLAKQKEERDKFNAQFAAATASAPARREADRPPVQVQQDGNVTRAKVQGSLAPTRDLACLRAEQIESAFTPPDLHTGFLKCLDERRAEDALLMFMMAGIYSRFDAQRIDDPSVQGGPQMLIIRTSSGFTPQQREFFVNDVQSRAGKPESTQAFCAALRRIGPPSYAPRYLVLHGLKAFTAANPMDNALRADFNADATWKTLLDSYAHCAVKP